MNSILTKDCLTLDGSRRGLAACLANQEEALNNLRQELVRTTLANQTMTNEKVYNTYSNKIQGSLSHALLILID